MTVADEKILMVMMAVTDMAKAKAFYYGPGSGVK
jgi:hypothetical protein